MRQENQNLEYKRNWNDEYLKWICGFANAQGGKIFIGVDDDGSIYGIKDSHKQMEDIPNKVVSFLGIVVDVYLHQRENLEYIEIIIPPSNVPISYSGMSVYIKRRVSNVNSNEVSQKTSQKASQKTSQKIIDMIKENPYISTQEMANTIGIDRRNIARNIKKLQENGIVKRIGPDKGGYWKIVNYKDL